MKAKLTIALIVTAIMTLAGCAKYPVSQSTGKEDMAYLLFVTGSGNDNDVTVTLDGEKVFTAKVVKQKNANRKGTSYGVATGRRKVKVQRDGKTLYDKEIFVSSQETKQIILP